MELSMATQDLSGRTVVSLKGELDIYSAPLLRTTLQDLIGQGNRSLVVDLTDVEFLDSTGLGVLVGTMRRTGEVNGDLRLVVASDRILRVFRMTSLTEVFDIRPTLDAALGDDPTVPSSPRVPRPGL